MVEYKLSIGNGRWPMLACRLVQAMLVGTGKKHTTYSVKLLEQFLMDPQCLGMFFGISSFTGANLAYKAQQESTWVQQNHHRIRSHTAK